MQISGFTWDPTKAFAEMNAVLPYLPSIPACFLPYVKACAGDPDLHTSPGRKHNRGKGEGDPGLLLLLLSKPLTAVPEVLPKALPKALFHPALCSGCEHAVPAAAEHRAAGSKPWLFS